MKALVLGLLLVVLFPLSARAEEGMLEEAHRFTSTAVCVDVQGPLTGWGVRRAIALWNNAGAVTLTLNPVCDPTQPHIYVRQVDFGHLEWGGQAEWPEWRRAFPGDTWTYTESTVTLNRHYMFGRCFDVSVTVHELGHAIGLPHNENTWSPMSDKYDREHRCGRIPRKDVEFLERLYE